jgi:hypothetical protein
MAINEIGNFELKSYIHWKPFGRFKMLSPKTKVTNEKAEFIHRHLGPKRKDMEGRRLKK